MIDIKIEVEDGTPSRANIWSTMLSPQASSLPAISTNQMKSKALLNIQEENSPKEKPEGNQTRTNK